MTSPIVHIIQLLMPFAEAPVVIGAIVFAHAISTRIGNRTYKASMLFVPILILCLYFVPSPPELGDENSMLKLFFHVGSFFLSMAVAAIPVVTIVHFFGHNPSIRKNTNPWEA